MMSNSSSSLSVRLASIRSRCLIKFKKGKCIEILWCCVRGGGGGEGVEHDNLASVK